MKINTIYPAFMGEVNCHGIGVPCTFVRLAGCNLRCYLSTKKTLCDTPEALDVRSGMEWSENEILTKVLTLGNNIVCLTGGEPLCQDVTGLLSVLSRAGIATVIETNGSMPIKKYRAFRNVSFVVDYKSTSSGENSNMLNENWLWMDEEDYLKFVIDDRNDYEEACHWISDHPDFRGGVAFGLFWGSKMGYQELMSLIIKDKLAVSLNMQTHKMACLYDEHRGDVQSLVIPKLL